MNNNVAEVKVAEDQNHILSDGWTHATPQKTPQKTQTDTKKIDRKERERLKYLKDVLTLVRQRKWGEIDRPLLDKAGLQSIPKIKKVHDYDDLRDNEYYSHVHEDNVPNDIPMGKLPRITAEKNNVVVHNYNADDISIIREMVRSAEAIRNEVKNKKVVA